MKALNLVCFSFVVALIFVGAGCGRKNADPVATAQKVNQSFQASPPETKQSAATAAAAVAAAVNAPRTDNVAAQRERYLQALRSMKDVIARGNLSKEQVQAMNQLFLQVNKAIQQNPALANKELYDARNAMAQALYRAGVQP